MGKLDLSKAVTAGAEGLLASRIMPSWWQENMARDASGPVVEAALPHILEALAEQAQQDADDAYPNDHNEGHPAEHAAIWLRFKAEEARA